MEKRAYIIHGWGGNPESNWFPWLKKELEAKNIKTAILAMPDSDLPKMNAWLSRMQKEIFNPDENVYLVGHSLGGIAILRYLEALPEGKQIGGAVLAAGFSESIGTKEIDNFFDKPVDYGKIKKSAKKITAINSDNDPFVPIKQGEILRDRLNAKLVILKNAYHMNWRNNFFKMPEVLDELLELMK